MLKVQFPLKCSNGTVELIEAYRAQHSHHRLPGISYGTGHFSATTLHLRCFHAYLDDKRDCFSGFCLSAPILLVRAQNKHRHAL